MTLDKFQERLSELLDEKDYLKFNIYMLDGKCCLSFSYTREDFATKYVETFPITDWNELPNLVYDFVNKKKQDLTTIRTIRV